MDMFVADIKFVIPSTMCCIEAHQNAPDKAFCQPM